MNKIHSSTLRCATRLRVFCAKFSAKITGKIFFPKCHKMLQIKNDCFKLNCCIFAWSFGTLKYYPFLCPAKLL